MALATLPSLMSWVNSLNVGAGFDGSLETTSRWATNTSRITIRIGKAALLRNLFSLRPLRASPSEPLRRRPVR